MPTTSRSVTVACPHCGGTFPISPERYEQIKGRRANCKRCEKPFVIEAPPAAAAAAPQQALVKTKVAPPPARTPVIMSIGLGDHPPVQIASAPPVPQYQCNVCQGWFDVNAIYSLNGTYICMRCHAARTAPPLAQMAAPPPPVMIMPAAAPAPPQVIVQNVIHNNVVAPHKRWSPGVAALLSFLWPGLGQMYKGQVINGLVWMVVVFIGYGMLVIPGLILHVCCILGAASGDPYR